MRRNLTKKPPKEGGESTPNPGINQAGWEPHRQNIKQLETKRKSGKENTRPGKTPGEPGTSTPFNESNQQPQRAWPTRALHDPNANRKQKTPSEQTDESVKNAAPPPPFIQAATRTHHTTPNGKANGQKEIRPTRALETPTSKGNTIKQREASDEKRTANQPPFIQEGHA